MSGPSLLQSSLGENHSSLKKSPAECLSDSQELTVSPPMGETPAQNAFSIKYPAGTNKWGDLFVMLHDAGSTRVMGGIHGMKPKARGRRDGFTLIEILLVVSILGVLAAIVVIKSSGPTHRARRQAAWVQAATIKTAITDFEMTLGRLPDDLKELVIEGDESWPGPFLDSEEVPRDPWGNEFYMQIKGKRIRVTSTGPDGRLGTDDDLWK